MAKPSAYTYYAAEALSLLGKQIKLARKRFMWSQQTLAEKAGIARATLQKIEKGETGCAIGTVFEVAALVGMKLFDADEQTLAERHDRTDERIALLPKATYKRNAKVIDDF